jgi:hypothetical protein
LFTNDDPLNAEDPLGLMLTSSKPETDAQVKAIATVTVKIEAQQDEKEAATLEGQIKSTAIAAIKELAPLQQQVEAETTLMVAGSYSLAVQYNQDVDSVTEKLSGLGQYLAQVSYAGYNLYSSSQDFAASGTVIADAQATYFSALGTASEIEAGSELSDAYEYASLATFAYSYSILDFILAILAS